MKGSINYCYNCGAHIENDPNYCPSCGSHINSQSHCRGHEDFPGGGAALCPRSDFPLVQGTEDFLASELSNSYGLEDDRYYNPITGATTIYHGHSCTTYINGKPIYTTLGVR